MPVPNNVIEFMSADHARLDDLLDLAQNGDGAACSAYYREFRQGLLQHIAMEEKVLLPAVRHKPPGIDPALAAKLRQDHGVLAALLVMPPAAGTLKAIREVLAAHNPLEEGPAGLYAQCQSLLEGNVSEVLAQCQRLPAVKVSDWVDSSKVRAAARRLMARAGYDSRLLDQH